MWLVSTGLAPLSFSVYSSEKKIKYWLASPSLPPPFTRHPIRDSIGQAELPVSGCTQTEQNPLRFPNIRSQRATAVDTEADRKEPNKGCSTTENHNSISVTMETAEQSKLVMDCEVEVAEDESPEQGDDFSANNEQVCLEETDSSEFLGGKIMPETLSADVEASATEADELACCEADSCTTVPCQNQVKCLVLEPGHDDFKRNESTTSSMSDTLSSADSVYENEAHRKTQDIPETEQVPVLEQYVEPEGHLVQSKEDFGTGENPLFQPDPESEPALDTVQDLSTEREQYSEPDYYTKPEQKTELEADLEFYHEPEQDPDLEFYPEPEFEASDDILNPDDDRYKNLAIYGDENFEGLQAPFEPLITEESKLEQCIKEEAMSDGSNESCHDPDYDDMVDCLRAEITAASSDSETDEKWRTIFSSSINKEDDDSYLDSLQLSAQELFVQKVESVDFEKEDENDFEEVSFEVPQVEGALDQAEDVVSVPVPQQEVKFNPLPLQGLSKISENDIENGKDAGHNHGNQPHPVVLDTTKTLPKDFCVIQETKSENVSTEHVDFRLARKQWQEMEAQTKNKIVSPTTGQQRFHGSHSFMYTPVRKIERAHKRENELESLALVGDYPQTQFSPCSEDSGLGDTSYRSPCDDPETPVEKEIRLSLEREENFKRERGLSRMGKSTDCAPSRSMPRSISTPLTPSFIITSSPTKEPLKSEVSVNNVIILDPSNNFTSSPRTGKDSTTAQSAEWRSEDGGSNVIILETSNLIIRSASEFSLSKACEQPQEKMFLNNPFFKLRSRSTMSLVDEEIKMVKLREEELKKERAGLYNRERFDTERSSRMDTLTFGHSVDVPMKCKSSPSSPMKTAYRMDRSVSSCDQRFPDVYTGSRRKSAMALRWEAGEFTKSD